MKVAAVAALLTLGAASPPAAAGPEAWRITVDLGAPDGLVAAVGYQLLRYVTVHGGVGHNLNSPGLRVGARLHPRTRTVTPYLAAEAGVYAEADTAAWLRSLARDVGLNDKSLESLGYRWGNAHLGVELGDGGARFYLQAGVTLVSASALVIKPRPTYIPPVDLYRDTDVRAWILAGHTGVTFAF